MLRINTVALAFFVFHQSTFAATCTVEYIKDPPAYISDVYGTASQNLKTPFKEKLVYQNADTKNGMVVENIRDYRRTKVIGRIPKGSLVRALPEQFCPQSESISDLVRRGRPQDSKNLDRCTYLQITVASVNTSFDALISDQEKELRQAVKPGLTGLMHIKTLKPATEKNSFLVKSDADIVEFEGADESSLSGRLVRAGLRPGDIVTPITKDGLFKTHLCCRDQSTCIRTHSFLLDRGGEDTKEVGMAMPECDTCHFQVIETANAKSLRNFAQTVSEYTGKMVGLDGVEINDFGLVRLPAELLTDRSHDEANSKIVARDPAGRYVHYQQATKLGPETLSGIWGKPHAVCAVMNLAQAWERNCIKESRSNCMLQFGDMSYATPALSGADANARDPIGHKSHSSGECIDIRPIRRDDVLQGTVIEGSVCQAQKKNPSRVTHPYDCLASEELIKLAYDLGATQIMYGHKVPGVSVLVDTGHEDHMHICFGRKNRAGQDNLMLPAGCR